MAGRDMRESRGQQSRHCGQKAFAPLQANCNSQKDHLSGPLLLLCSMREIDGPMQELKVKDEFYYILYI